MSAAFLAFICFPLVSLGCPCFRLLSLRHLSLCAHVATAQGNRIAFVVIKWLRPRPPRKRAFRGISPRSCSWSELVVSFTYLPSRDRALNSFLACLWHSTAGCWDQARCQCLRQSATVLLKPRSPASLVKFAEPSGAKPPPLPPALCFAAIPSKTNQFAEPQVGQASVV